MAQFLDIPKPRYKVFFELVAETRAALKNVNIIEIRQRGIKSVYQYLKTNRIKLAHGSIRFDRDRSGTVFIQEFRPSPSIFQRGEFYSIGDVRPFWEIAGTAIIRLARRKNRFSRDPSINKRQKYCIILQGGLNINYVASLLERGSVSYNTNQTDLREAPVFSALSILNRISREQILELKLSDKNNPEIELNKSLFPLGKSVKNIACMVGKNTQGEYYTAPQCEERDFPIHICTNKVIPIEISEEITRAQHSLLQDGGVIVLDGLTFEELSACLKNRESFYQSLSGVSDKH